MKVALVITLVILTTHFQLAYFLFGAAGLYYVFRLVVDFRAASGRERGGGGSGRSPGIRALARFGLFMAAASGGAGAAGIQLVPAFEYVNEFSRRTATTTEATPEENRAYASSWSLHPEEVVSTVVPEFAGNNSYGAPWSQGSYWGRNATRDNLHYAGWVVLLLAVVAFFGAPRAPLRWFFFGLGALAILYALGTHTPVWGAFYALLPGIDLFRAPDMVAFLFGFSAITLMAFGVDRLLRLARDEDGGAEDFRLVRALWILTALAGVGLLMAASGALFSIWTSLIYPDMDPVRLQILDTQRPFIVQGFFVVTALAAATAGIATAVRKGVFKPVVLVGVLGMLIFLDGFRISSTFVQTFDFYTWARPDPIVQELLGRQASEEPFRVASLERSGQAVTAAMHGIELATGHHPNDLARYRELIGMVGSSSPENMLNPNVRAVLNVRYLIWPDNELGEVEGGPPPLARTQLGGAPYQSLYEVPTLPRARLVAAARVVSDEQAVATILSDAFDPATEAVLAEEPPVALGGGVPVGQVVWEERGLNRQRLRVNTDRAALLVLADNWYPSWSARVDGEEAPVLRAYHTLRAIPVQPGEHIVEIAYRSRVLGASLWLSVFTLLLLALIGTVSYLRERQSAVAAAVAVASGTGADA